MTYCTVADMRVYLDIAEGDDDELLNSLIARAAVMLETYTHRVFKASANSLRYFTVGKDTSGFTLHFDEDLAATPTTVISNANGVSPDTIPSTDYILLPRNRTPYHALRILSSSDYDWDYTDDPEGGITVLGKWAYSLEPPADIVHACVRLASYFYRQKDAQVFDTTALPSAGVIQIPQGLPKDVQIILEPYVKRVMV
jgi:hypothetical protein